MIVIEIHTWSYHVENYYQMLIILSGIKIII